MRNKIRAVVTGAEIETPDGVEFSSYPGASYGGIVIKSDADFEDCFGVVKALIKYCKETGFSSISLTQTPILYYKVPQQGIEFALIRHGFEVSRCELTQSVELQKLSTNPLDSLVDKTRNACRQAEKHGCIYREGVELSGENLTDFHKLLYENRKYLGVRPTHTLDELITLAKLIPEKLHLSFIEHDSERIAGLLHFICNPRVALLFYVCHNREKQNLKPAPYILANTLNWAKQGGYAELDFGISTVKGEPNRGLLKFKENFRTRPFLRNSYYLKLI